MQLFLFFRYTDGVQTLCGDSFVDGCEFEETSYVGFCKLENVILKVAQNAQKMTFFGLKM